MTAESTLEYTALGKLIIEQQKNASDLDLH